MLFVIFGKVFDTKIINAKAESGLAHAVLSQASSERTRSITMGFQVLYKLVISKDSGLLQAVHTLLNEYINISIQGNF